MDGFFERQAVTQNEVIAMHLVPPDSGKLQWKVRFRNHDGRTVKIPGDRDEAIARRIGDRVEMLVRAKANADHPPVELMAWIDNMPQKLAERLIELGLLERRRVESTKALTEQIDEFEKVVANRKSNSPVHAKVQANRVKRLCKKVQATNFVQLDEDNVAAAVKDMNLALSSQRHYIIAVKDFAKWMKKTGRSAINPLIDLKAPGQYEDPEVERRPMTVAEFRKLAAYLGTFELYKGQQARWTAYDRKMIYWTAVKTAYRKTELSKLRVANLHLDEKPPCISIKARHAKNKTAGDVPIPNDLAVALKKYVKDRQLEPHDKLFVFPLTSRGVLSMFRRDLKEAGIEATLPTGEVIDFHALRSTAITWWLDVDGLSAKRVQILARLKTLGLVAKYSRNYRIADFGWLNKGPQLVTKKKARKKAG
jgi:integrase